jgi:DNA-binding NarL/FixJ family response regulator
MDTKKKIFIIEDHQLFREGLKAMLATSDDYEVIGEAANGMEALQRLQKIKPDLILLDLSMPKINGYSVLREIRRVFASEIKVLILSIHETDQYVLQAFEEKADGYCVKDSSREELRLAIRSVLDGKRYISPGVTGQVLEGYVRHNQQLKPKSTWDNVTHREKEVLKLLAEGHSNKAIGEVLHISVKTVEKHRASLMNKLDLHNAASLTAYAAEQGLIWKESL